MKLTSLLENFKQAVLTVSHIAGKNINLPILGNILIEAKEGGIKLVATNLEIGAVCFIRGKVEKEGSFTVNAKILADYISLLPNEKIELEEKSGSLLVSCNNYKTKISGQAAEEFPLIPAMERDKCFSVFLEDFRRALTQVVFAVAQNETRLELSGVLFDFQRVNNQESRLFLAATDSYRLAEKEIKVAVNGFSEEDEKRYQIIVPVKTAQELIRILSSLKDGGEAGEKEAPEIKFYLSENQILFTVGNIELVSRLIEGQYPDYKQIIPLNSKTKVSLNKNELMRAVKASALFSKSGINDISLDCPQGKDEVVVSSASSQTGENITKVKATASGEDNGVVVNYRYLLDVLSILEGESVNLEIIDSNTPCIIKPEREEGYLYLIMPIKN